MRVLQLLTLTVLLFLPLVLHAQEVYIDLSDGSTETYALSEIQNIRFVGDQVLVEKTDGTIVQFPFIGVERFRYSSLTTGITIAAPPASSQLTVQPNAGNGPVSLSYSLAGSAHVRLLVLDSGGRLVQRLVDQRQGAGPQTFQWDPSALSVSPALGLFHCVLEVDGQASSQPYVRIPQ